MFAVCTGVHVFGSSFRSCMKTACRHFANQNAVDCVFDGFNNGLHPPPLQEAKEHDPLAAGMLAWASPLTHDWSPSSAPRQVSTAAADQDGSSSSGYAAFGGAATAAAGLVAAATAVAAAAQPPPASALGLAMRLVEGSQAAGITGG